jgi:catecholate siderophore receptor
MSRRRSRQDTHIASPDSHPTKKRYKQQYPQPQKVVAPIVALTVALTGANALAQDREILTAPPIEVQEQRPGYTVPYLGLSRFPEPIRDIPQSITVVPQEQMIEQGAVNIRDALRHVTGISFQAGEGGVQGDNLTLRGFNARNDFFIEGVRDIGTYSRDIFHLEAVEVLKGPSALYFGRGSMGGSLTRFRNCPVSRASILVR